MNIAIDIRPLSFGDRTGVGEYAYGMLQALLVIDKKNEYFLFTNSRRKIPQEIEAFESKNVRIVKTSYPNKLFNCCQILARRPRLDKLIQTRCAINQPIDCWLSFNLNFTSLDKRTKYLLTIHDLSFVFFPQYFSLKRRYWHNLLSARRQCHSADWLFTPSRSSRCDLIEVYGPDPEKIITINPSVSKIFTEKDIEDREYKKTVKEKYNLPEKYILYFGTVEPRKNIESCIQAFCRSHYLNQAGFELVIAGARGWSDKKILQKIACEENVRYIGYIPQSDKPAVYSLASAFVYVSVYEGFGLPVLEAFKAGVPVITSNNSSLPEVAEDAAILVDPRNITQIRRAMEELLLRDESLADILIAKGRSRVEHFSWLSSAERLLTVMQNGH